MHPFLQLSPEVESALSGGKPVVALESTIITHGMPWPENVETAILVEKAVRDAGAVPATCALLGGKMVAGLSADQLEYLGKNGFGITKASRRDLPYLLSKKLPGATTVASTMMVAQAAGIRVFATGGIGGVHRGAGESFDVSADLQELAHTNVCVVCAGAKSILDIGLTLEYLETHGVPVLGFQTNHFPAFYHRESGFGVDYQMETYEEVAQLLHTKWQLGLNGGCIVGNPIPKAYELDKEGIDAAIENALLEAQKKQIRGKEITPFLLGKVKELTGGMSLESNIALVLNNATVASGIAVAYSLFEDKKRGNIGF